MAANTRVFSLEGKGLKLDTASDVEAHIKPLREMEDVEEVRLLGNTLGVEACKVLGEVLETKKSLQVSFTVFRRNTSSVMHSWLTPFRRLLTWPIYLLVVCLMRFLKHCRLFSLHF
jgi:hypothetical protein